MPACTHASEINPAVPAGPADVCPACAALGSRWVHLRRCAACGHVGCCDSSPLKHAQAHFRETQHPVIRSAQPGEDWLWCYVDRVYIEP